MVLEASFYPVRVREAGGDQPCRPKMGLLKFMKETLPLRRTSWDRSQKRRRPSGQQGALRQEESQQPLTDLSPAGVTVLGAFGDSPTPTPDHEEPRGGPRPGMPQPKGAPAFQLNR